MKKTRIASIIMALVLVLMCVSCKSADVEYVYVPQTLDISEPNGIMFDSRPHTGIMTGDATTYEGLYNFAFEVVDAYAQWFTYADNLETYLRALEEQLKGGEETPGKDPEV